MADEPRLNRRSCALPVFVTPVVPVCCSHAASPGACWGNSACAVCERLPKTQICRWPSTIVMSMACPNPVNKASKTAPRCFLDDDLGDGDERSVKKSRRSFLWDLFVELPS